MEHVVPSGLSEPPSYQSQDCILCFYISGHCPFKIELKSNFEMTKALQGRSIKAQVNTL